VDQAVGSGVLRASECDPWRYAAYNSWPDIWHGLLATEAFNLSPKVMLSDDGVRPMSDEDTLAAECFDERISGARNVRRLDRVVGCSPGCAKKGDDRGSS
jgi:hypothetical protein